MVRFLFSFAKENNKYCHWPPDTDDESGPDDEFLRAMYREKNKN